MPGLTAAQFVDFFNSTRATKLTDASFLVNLAQRTSYPFFQLMKNRNADDVARGGTSIVEVAQFRDTASFRGINPGDRRTVAITSGTGTLSFAYRFYESQSGWTDAEYMLQTSGGDFVQVKRFSKVKDQQGATDHINGLDALLFKVPDQNRMELAPAGVGGPVADVYSLPVWMTEDALNPSANIGRPPGWTTTIGGVDPTAEAGWRCKQQYFDPANLADPFNGIIAAFDRAELQVVFRPPPEAGDNMQQQLQSDVVIYTNSDGMTRIQQLCRVVNDRLKSVSDPAVGVATFDGMPFVHVPLLDTANLDQTRGTAGVASSYNSQPYPNGKPRYFLVPRSYIRPVFAMGGIMDRKPVMRGGIEYPDVNVQYTNSSLNIVCNARNRACVIAPSS